MGVNDIPNTKVHRALAQVREGRLLAAHGHRDGRGERGDARLGGPARRQASAPPGHPRRLLPAAHERRAGQIERPANREEDDEPTSASQSTLISRAFLRIRLISILPRPILPQLLLRQPPKKGSALLPFLNWSPEPPGW
ncbi:hypothetical protein SETIT_2G157100v2 [Setaria italica]|uniref:Uncharacterized protein n=1 Tax=Setaria italica TaxID=4555 RepID=A0A368PZ36_SETIT|nr:hypothetical protein SETIT_2G157100v2 [Setaria italica]